MSLDKTYLRSHMGLTVASIWNMKSSEEEAAEAIDEDDRFTRATLTKTDDIVKSQGKPEQSPKSISDLVVAIECYITHLEAFLTGNADHQRMVHRLRIYLRERFTNGPLNQLDDIFWEIFLDGQQYFKMIKGTATTGLYALAGMLSCKSMPILIVVPYSKLILHGQRSKAM